MTAELRREFIVNLVMMWLRVFFSCSPCRVSLHHHLQQDFLKFLRLLHLGLEAHPVPLSTCSLEEQVTDTSMVEVWKTSGFVLYKI